MDIFKKQKLEIFLLLIILGWVNSGLLAQPTGDDLYNEAISKYQQKSFREARLLFEKYITTIPKGQHLAKSYFHLAELFEDFSKTISYYNKVINDFPDSKFVDDSYYQLGMTHFLLNDYEAALLDYQKLLARFPTSAYADKAQYQLGKTLFTLNRISKAKAAFQFLIREYQGSTEIPKAILGLADCLHQENKHKEALKEMLAFDQLYPKSDLKGIAYLNIAESYRMLGDDNLADTYYQKVITQYPNSFEAEVAQRRILAAKNKTTYFSVQLGAFSVKENAVRLHKRLTTKGFKDVYLKTRKKGDKTLNVVFVGKFEKKEQAEKIMEIIKLEERVSPRIVFVNQ